MLKTRNANTREAPPHRNSDLAAQHDKSCLLTTPCTRVLPQSRSPPTPNCRPSLEQHRRDAIPTKCRFTRDFGKRPGRCGIGATVPEARRKPQKLKLDSRTK